MERVVPWAALCSLIEPFYPKGETGRLPFGVERMLRIYCLQQWFNFSDPAAQEGLYDSLSIRRFVSIDLRAEPVPDETTICRFRHLLEAHDFGRRMFEFMHEHLEAKGLRLSSGTIVDATVIHAPRSTKNEDKARDPDIHQTKKGNRWYSTHSILYAENCPVEIFFDDRFHSNFQDKNEYYKIYGRHLARSMKGIPRLEHGLLLETLQRRINAQAGIKPITPIIGTIDEINSLRFRGWAIYPSNAEASISLELFFNKKYFTTILANHFRPDLRIAGIGSGCHGFELNIPPHIKGDLAIRRSTDGLLIPVMQGPLAAWEPIFFMLFFLHNVLVRMSCPKRLLTNHSTILH